MSIARSFAALCLAAGLLLPAVAVRAEAGVRIAAVSAAKVKPKPKAKPKAKATKPKPKPKPKAKAKSPAPKARGAASGPMRTELQDAQQLAVPAGSRLAPTLVKSSSC